MVKGKSKYAELNDENFLYQKYWLGGLSCQKLGEGVGCSPNTVLRALKTHTIQRRTYSETARGRKTSEATKKKQSEAKKGNKHCLGRILSIETKRRIGRSNKGNKPRLGKRHSLETRKKIGDAQRRFSPAQRKLNCLMRSRIRDSLNGTKQGRHWEIIVGYTLFDLMKTLEKEFREGMTWNNHGAFWHIDHIIPLAHFHYDSPEDPEFKKAWSLGNLQPLLATENLKKGTKFRFY